MTVLTCRCGRTRRFAYAGPLPWVCARCLQIQRRAEDAQSLVAHGQQWGLADDDRLAVLGLRAWLGVELFPVRRVDR